MKEEWLVCNAQSGDTEAFSKLVEIYQWRIYGYAWNRLKNDEDAQEAVQNCFMQAFLKMSKLRNIERFSAWLFSICRNEVLQIIKDRNLVEIPFDEGQYYDFNDNEKPYWEESLMMAQQALGILKAEQRKLMELKYLAGYSMEEIHLITGLSIARIKSRLFEARKKIRQTLPLHSSGLELSHQELNALKESVMKSVELVKSGARIISRLSLEEQCKFCRSAVAQERFDETMLQAIGRVSGSEDFLTQSKGTVVLSDLTNILEYVDSFTEARILEELESKDPTLADKIKQNMFIFDDLVLFDSSAIALLLEKVDTTDMQIALATAHGEVKKLVYTALGQQKAKQWKEQIGFLDMDEEDIREKKVKIVEIVRSLEQAGDLICSRDNTNSLYPIVFTVK